MPSRSRRGKSPASLAAGVRRRVDITTDRLRVSPCLTERIAACATGGEVLVSASSTADCGFGLAFYERGNEAIEGMASPLKLLAVMVEQHPSRSPAPGQRAWKR